MNIKNFTDEEAEQLHSFYYALGHIIIRDIVLNRPGQLAVLKYQPEGQLKRLWFNAWQESDLAAKPDLHDFTCSFITQGPYEVILFKFPEPFWITDAWQAAAVKKGDAQDYRYFLLENSADSTPEQPRAMLGEWQPDMHINHGMYDGNVQDQTAFLETVLQEAGKKVLPYFP